MAKFEARDGKLYINGKEVLKGWESFTGWYWFAVEKVREQTSLINGKPVKDVIYYGFVQGLCEEWGYFSQAEIERLKPKTWRIPNKNLPWSGRRKTTDEEFYKETDEADTPHGATVQTAKGEAEK